MKKNISLLLGLVLFLSTSMLVHASPATSTAPKKKGGLKRTPTAKFDEFEGREKEERAQGGAKQSERAPPQRSNSDLINNDRKESAEEQATHRR